MSEKEKASKRLMKVRKSRGMVHIFDVLCDQFISRKSIKFYKQRGYRMAIYANDKIGIEINQFGYHEGEELDILFHFLLPIREQLSTGVALDIGANIGNHSIYFSKYFSHVHAFEPNPNTYYLLEFNAKWYKNITTHMFGLGEKKGKFSLIENETNFGNSYISTDKNTNNKKVSVKIERLDDIGLDLSDLCFIKMDVEGFEENVVKGAITILNEYEPLIVLEQHRSDFVDKSTPAIDLLKDLGYRICWHQSGSRFDHLILRRLFSLSELVVGRRHQILCGCQIPKRSHPMLIAVPTRFQHFLGIE